MPLYVYYCKTCESRHKLLLSTTERAETIECPNCGSKAQFQLPSEGSTEIKEAPDKYTGKQIRKDVQKQLQDRMSKHHDEYEITEKIDKYGIKEAERHGWTKKVKKI